MCMQREGVYAYICEPISSRMGHSLEQKWTDLPSASLTIKGISYYFIHERSLINMLNEFGRKTNSVSNVLSVRRLSMSTVVSAGRYSFGNVLNLIRGKKQKKYQTSCRNQCIFQRFKYSEKSLFSGF